VGYDDIKRLRRLHVSWSPGKWRAMRSVAKGIRRNGVKTDTCSGGHRFGNPRSVAERIGKPVSNCPITVFLPSFLPPKKKEACIIRTVKEG